MPPTKGQGQSAITPEKERVYGLALGHQLNVVDAIFKKHKGQKFPYVYIDATAGQGINPLAGVDGSPKITIDALRNAHIHFEAHLIDEVPEYTESLHAWLGGDPRVHIHTGNNRDILPEILDRVHPLSYGLLYFDYNGTPDFDLIQAACAHPNMRYVDLLIRTQTTMLKRGWLADQPHQRIGHRVADVGKSHWMISEYLPSDPCRWVFFFGLNTGDVSPYPKIGFYDIDSVRGQQILANVNYTCKEQREFPDLYQPFQRSLSGWVGGA